MFFVVLNYFYLSFVRIHAVFYFNYINYFGLLIFCCQNVAIFLILYCWFYFESPIAVRRSEFRYAKRARQTFMCGGASAAGRMKVYCKSSAPLR